MNNWMTGPADSSYYKDFYKSKYNILVIILLTNRARAQIEHTYITFMVCGNQQESNYYTIGQIS